MRTTTLISVNLARDPAFDDNNNDVHAGPSRTRPETNEQCRTVRLLGITLARPGTILLTISCKF